MDSVKHTLEQLLGEQQPLHSGYNSMGRRRSWSGRSPEQEEESVGTAFTTLQGLVSVRGSQQSQ
jgi:hypothetical protein